jgi:hypothetical protein
MSICPAKAPANLIGINALPKRRQLLRGYMRDAADLQATPESVGTVRIIVVPHCTQQWVTSSRPVAAAPSASSAGSIAVITILCTQTGQGTSRDGKRDGLTSW